MHPLAKVFLGIILILASIWWVWKGSMELIDRPGIEDLKTVLNGAIPPLIFLLGVFIVWLEYDEWKIEQELKKEEEKLKRKARKKKRRRR